MSEQIQQKSALSDLSNQLASAVELAGASVVRIDDGTRLTASGIIWSADGVIVATSHGVERDEDVTVQLSNGRALAATIIGRDPESDIVVLRVEDAGLPAFNTADPDSVRVGSLVLALGRPGHHGLRATMGIVSSKLEVVDSGRAEYILHTDADLYPGFSGGALVNTDGQFVGLLNLMFGRGSGVALGAPTVKNVVDSILKHGRIKRGYLGISTQLVAIPATLKSSASVTQDRGLLVIHVQPDSPAERAGLTIGDVLLAVDEVNVSDVDDLRSRLRTKTAGDAVTLRVLRGGSLTEVAATLGEEK